MLKACRAKQFVVTSTLTFNTMYHVTCTYFHPSIGIGLSLLYQLWAVILVLCVYFPRRNTSIIHRNSFIHFTDTSFEAWYCWFEIFVNIGQNRVKKPSRKDWQIPFFGTIISRYGMKIQPIYFNLAQFHPRNTIGQPLFLNVEYWRSHKTISR